MPNCFSENIRLFPARKVCLALAVLFLLIAVSYANSINSPWYFDDYGRIVNASSINIRSLSWETIRQSFYSGSPGRLYRPVACLSFALNYYFDGYDVTAYHLTNILIHWISSVVLFLFIYVTLKTTRFAGGFGEKAWLISLLATVLWAVNPIQVGAVTYIVQRMASLAGMFFISSMFCYLLARTTRFKVRQILFGTLCVFFGLLAFGSKENTIILPFIILLYEVLILQVNFVEEIKKKNVFLALVALGIVVGVLAVFLLEGRVASVLKGYDYRPFTLGQRLLTEPRIVVFYLSLIFYPIFDRFSLFHSIEISKSLFEPLTSIGSIFLIATLLFFALRLWHKKPLISFSILFFFLNHVIESTFLPLELVYEHRNYIPSMFIFLPVSVLVVKSHDYYHRKNHYVGNIIMIFIFVYFFLFLSSTLMCNKIWSNSESLWLNVIDKYPNNMRANDNLGVVYFKQGRYELAKKHHLIALMSPEQSRLHDKLAVYGNLGRVYTSLLQFEMAREKYWHIVKTIEENQSLKNFFPLVMVYNGIAATYIEEGEFEKAFPILQKADTIEPNNLYVYTNLGICYVGMQNMEKAVEILTKITWDNQDKMAKVKMGLALSYKGLSQFERAEWYFRELIKNDINNLAIYFHLFDLLILEGKEIQAYSEMDSLFESRKFSKSDVQDLKLNLHNMGTGWMRLKPNRMENLILWWLDEQGNHKNERY